MRIPVIMLVLLIFMQTAGAEIVIEQLEDPPYLNQDGTVYTPPAQEVVPQYNPNDTQASNVKNNINSMQLSKIERRIFGRNFIGDSGQNRLARLEQRIFGAAQNGDANDRLKRLNTASKSYSVSYPTQYNYYDQANLRQFPPRYYNQYNNPYNMYAPYQPYRRTGIKEFFKVMTGGSLTGYSPSPSLNSLDSYTQNMYSNNNPYYTSVPGVGTGSNHMDLFSNGASGSETYYDDGRYRRDLNSTGGSCGVKVIY